jgi:hypothetical protein
MKYFLAILITYSIASLSDANETKKVMQKALDSIIHLAPYMSNEMRFKDPDNEKIISLHLNKIVENFKSAKHVTKLERPGFSPNFRMIKDHLDDTLLNFNNHNKSFARLRLAATTSLCLSCHTQLPKDHLTSYILNSEAVTPKSFENSYEYANFLFLLRSYRKAIKTYKISITDRLAKQAELKKIQKILGETSGHYDKVLYNSFKNILIINAKILRTPKKAIKLFNSYLSVSLVPKYIKTDLKIWIKELRKWDNSNDLNIKFTSDKDVGSFIQKYLVKLDQEGMALATGEYDVDLLITSGILSNYLTDHPKTKYAPEILYWNGISESRLSKNMFFTLGDLYLKECITRYPKSKVAIKCYNEYENEIQFRFTGTLGTQIPKSKKQELKKLKSLIKN